MAEAQHPKGRPEDLWPLFAPLEVLEGVGPKTARHYKGLDVETPKDLLLTLPLGGVDRSRKASIRDVALPGMATVEVTVGRHRPPSGRGRPYRIEVEDAATSFQLVFFHGRDEYLTRTLPTGSRPHRVGQGGTVRRDRADAASRSHPATRGGGRDPRFYEAGLPADLGGSRKRVSARLSPRRWSARRYWGEWIDGHLMDEKRWPVWDEALRTVHAPTGPEDLSRGAPARERLAFDELFAHQLTLALARAMLKRGKGRVTEGCGRLRARVLESLPYKPTGAQVRAVEEIAADMARPTRMNRLLQGDVGAGKTLVALMALLVAVEAGGQGVLMAPTSILAGQHHANLRPLAEAAGVVIEMLTGADKGAERRAKLAALKRGDIQILVGTHAVFMDDVEFGDLRLAIVDEQHRFGVRQRIRLGEKGQGADVLVMTATPIPRTLSLATYGDMDVSVLDEKPPGRTPVTTALVSAGRMDEVVDHLRKAVAEGRQAYWVCPLVEESENFDATAAEERFKMLRAALGEGGGGAGPRAASAGSKRRPRWRASRGATRGCWWRRR